MSVAIITDSAASVPVPGAGHGVRVVPMTVVLGGVVYEDGTLSPAELLERAGIESVTTSAPSPGAFAKAIEDADATASLVITVSSRMSASHQAARLAAASFPAGSVVVLDSGTAAGAQGLVVQAAAEAAAIGADLDAVASRARRVAEKVRLLAAVGDLEHLVRSGRVPALAARVTNSLDVRPLFEMSRGRVRPQRPARGTSAALGRIAEAVKGRSCGGLLRAAVMHAQSLGEARLLAAHISADHPDAEVSVIPFSSVMVAHTGPGLVGAAWWRDDDVEMSSPPVRPAA